MDVTGETRKECGVETTAEVQHSCHARASTTRQAERETYISLTGRPREAPAAPGYLPTPNITRRMEKRSHGEGISRDERRQALAR